MQTEDEVKVLTVEEIAVLREIARWRRANGVTYFQWRPGKGFGEMTEWGLWRGDSRNRKKIHVTYEPDRGSCPGSLAATHDYYGDEEVRPLPVTTVTQAIDVLAALDYLPMRFSSAYAVGRAERTAEVIDYNLRVRAMR